MGHIIPLLVVLRGTEAIYVIDQWDLSWLIVLA